MDGGGMFLAHMPIGLNLSILIGTVILFFVALQAGLLSKHPHIGISFCCFAIMFTLFNPQVGEVRAGYKSDNEMQMHYTRFRFILAGHAPTPSDKIINQLKNQHGIPEDEDLFHVGYTVEYMGVDLRYAVSYLVLSVFKRSKESPAP